MTSPQRYTARDMLAMGLNFFRYYRWEKYQHEANISRFKTQFGVTPATAANAWNKMIESDNPEVRIFEDRSTQPKYLLLALRWLWKYETDEQVGLHFGIFSPNTTRKYLKIWVQKIQLLLPALLGTFDENDDGLIFFGSIDGVHCPIEEPRPFSAEWSSHKFGGNPGVDYELVVCLNKPKLAWVCGPIKPGKCNDVSTHRRKLKGILETSYPGLRLIGDKGYRGEPLTIATRNEFDPEEIAEFKDRVLSRHETFNQRLKCFKVLSTPWRHGVYNHGIAFESCCSLVMLQIENGSQTLFDPYP